MYKIKKPSGWKWKTSAGISVGYKIVSARKGLFILTNPTGIDVMFHYFDIGGGFSVGPQYKDFSLSGSAEDYYSNGQISLLDTFPGDVLTSHDIEGFCLLKDIFIVTHLGGVSATMMLLGIPWQKMPVDIVRETGTLGVGFEIAEEHPNLVYAIAGPLGAWLFEKGKDAVADILQSNAKALLIMGGMSKGVLPSAGISGSLGYVWTGAMPTMLSTSPIFVSHDDTTIRSSSAALDRWDVIKIPGDALFDFDKSDIKPKAETVLKQVAGYILVRSPRRISVEGHTDAIGDAGYNMGLSNRRAQAIANWLSRNGVKASDVKTMGWGKSKPVAPNDTPAGREKNRRVEVLLFK